MTLLVTAIQNGLGEIDWSAATDNARWDHSTLVYEACDRASGGSDEEVRAKALELIAAGELPLDPSLKLRENIDLTLTDAASRLIALEAQAALDAEESELRERESKLADLRLDVAAAIREALGPKCKQVADGYRGFGSIYLRYDNGLSEAHLRVSDHSQKAGGAFNERTGERRGDVDYSWIITDPTDGIPSREEIRVTVAKIVREQEKKR